MNIPVLTPELMQAFILVLVRTTVIIMMVPVLGERTVPARIKTALSLLVALLVFPLVRTQLSYPPVGALLPLILRIGGEILLGVCIGMTARFIFAGIQMAGELIGFQMGFSVASVIDPTANVQVNILGEFQYMVSMLIFLVINGHHVFLSALAESFNVTALPTVSHPGELLSVMVNLSGDIFIIAVKISAPIMTVLLFINVAMGLVARTVPQMNVFIVSFPLQISVGLIFLGLTASVFVQLLQRMFSGLAQEIALVMKILSL